MTQVLILVIALLTVGAAALAFYLNEKITKFVVITLFVILANVTYFALDGVKGWPAEEPSVVKGTLASVVIVNPSRTDDGAIYVGIFIDAQPKWYEYTYPRYAPKTFFVEYSNNRAAEFERAKSAMANGQKVQINGIPPKEGEPSDGEAIEGDAEGFLDYIGKALKSMMPREKDTYKPAPDIQISEPGIPPEKGTN